MLRTSIRSLPCVAVHGLKSGKMLKEMRGHTSYVNCSIYSPDGSQASITAPCRIPEPSL